jgi:hypothetical protein
MYQIPLASVPNQTISFNVDGAYWQVHIYQSLVHMCADIINNGVPVINGVRCFAGVPLMPYPYMYDPNFGNFIFDSDADWTNFGTDCNLYYATSSEFEVFQSALLSGATA